MYVVKKEERAKLRVFVPYVLHLPTCFTCLCDFVPSLPTCFHFLRTSRTYIFVRVLHAFIFLGVFIFLRALSTFTF